MKLQWPITRTAIVLETGEHSSRSVVVRRDTFDDELVRHILAYLSDGVPRTPTSIWHAIWIGPMHELSSRHAHKALRALVDRELVTGFWQPSRLTRELEYVYQLAVEPPSDEAAAQPEPQR